MSKLLVLVAIFFLMSGLALAGTHHRKKHPKPKPTPTTTTRIFNPVDAPD